MRAARLHAPIDIRLHDEPDPEPGKNDELIRVTAVGLCGSDRHWFIDGGIGDANLTQPLVLGHEIAGIIETGAQRGRRVAVDPAIPCGTCDLCAADMAHLCRELKFAGHDTTDGGLRTLMAWPRNLLAPLPDTIDDTEAALLEPLGVALHATDLGKIAPGMSAGVFGCGPIGLLTILVLRQLGVRRVLATDPLALRRAAASALGASDVRQPVAGPDGGDGAAHPSWPPLDVAFEAAGEDGAVDDAIAAVRPGGRVVLIGIPASDRTSFRASVARRKGLTFHLSRRMRAADLKRAIDMAERGSVDLRSLITEQFTLERSSEAFASLARQDGLKVVVEPAN